MTIEPKRFTDLTPQQQSQRWHYSNEREWHQMVTETARLCGWQVFHWRDSRFTTAGWPDLALLKPPQFMLAELKTDDGRLTRQQKTVLAGLHASGIEVHVWRPADEREVRARLKQQ